jgi:hypothetical protein
MPISISPPRYKSVVYKIFYNKRQMFDSMALLLIHDEYLIGFFFGLS